MSVSHDTVMQRNSSMFWEICMLTLLPRLIKSLNETGSSCSKSKKKPVQNPIDSLRSKFRHETKCLTENESKNKKLWFFTGSLIWCSISLLVPAHSTPLKKHICVFEQTRCNNIISHIQLEGRFLKLFQS